MTEKYNIYEQERKHLPGGLHGAIAVNHGGEYSRTKNSKILKFENLYIANKFRASPSPSSEHARKNHIALNNCIKRHEDGETNGGFWTKLIEGQNGKREGEQRHLRELCEKGRGKVYDGQDEREDDRVVEVELEALENITRREVQNTGEGGYQEKESHGLCQTLWKERKKFEHRTE